MSNNSYSAYYLEPKSDNHKSFYKKAYVKVWGNCKELYSYGTRVAMVKANPNGYNEKLVLGNYATCSATTLRHLKEFMVQEGFEVFPKAKIRDHYESARW